MPACNIPSPAFTQLTPPERGNYVAKNAFRDIIRPRNSFFENLTPAQLCGDERCGAASVLRACRERTGRPLSSRGVVGGSLTPPRAHLQREFCCRARQFTAVGMVRVLSPPKSTASYPAGVSRIRRAQKSRIKLPSCGTAAERAEVQKSPRAAPHRNPPGSCRGLLPYCPLPTAHCPLPTNHSQQKKASSPFDDEAL
jgi:hypothetical protein